MTLKLNGSSSGSVSIDAPASTTGGADVALTLPVNDGESGQVLRTNGSGALTWIYPAGYGAFRVFRNSAQTITHDTYEVVECANESFDLQNWYDTSTFKYTPQVAGYYQFDAHIWIAGLSTNNVELQVALYKNTTRVTRSCKTDTTTYNGQQGQGIHDIIQLNGSSDYVQLRLLQYNSSSSNRDLSFGTELTYFSGFLLEAT